MGCTTPFLVLRASCLVKTKNQAPKAKAVPSPRTPKRPPARQAQRTKHQAQRTKHQYHRGADARPLAEHQEPSTTNHEPGTKHQALSRNQYHRGADARPLATNHEPRTTNHEQSTTNQALPQFVPPLGRPTAWGRLPACTRRAGSGPIRGAATGDRCPPAYWSPRRP